MNYTFQDISSAMLNMGQPELSQNMKMGTMDTKNSGPKEQLFAKKLDKILEKGKSPADHVLPDAIAEPASEKSEELIEFFNEKLGNKKGAAFLSELKKVFLMLSGGDLGNLSIDGQGLDVLKQLLSKAGFSSDELDELMNELTQGLEENKLTMDDLFDQLFELPTDLSTDFDAQSEQFLEMSALPFLHSIFTALNIPNETAQQIISDADKGDKGISLDVILDKLHQLQKKAFHTHTQYQTKDGDDQIQSLLKPLGIETDTSKSKVLTLNDLVNSFEAMRKKMSVQNLNEMKSDSMDLKEGSTAKSTDLIKDLFKGLEIQNLPKEKPVFEFSLDQLKNQFKDEFINPKNAGVVPNDQALDASNKKMGKGQVLKDLASALDGKLSENEIGKTNMKEGLADGKTMGKELKTRMTNLADQSQISASDTKSSETQSDIKPKATLKNLPNYVTQQVTKSIVKAINQGENVLKIQLKPAALGRLTMTIDNSGDNMKINIVTEHAAAREILASNVQEIRTVLSHSGVNLEQFDVDMNSDFKQSLADTKHQSDNSNKKNKNREEQMFDSVTGEITSEAVDLMEAIDQGKSLHFVA